MTGSISEPIGTDRFDYRNRYPIGNIAWLGVMQWPERRGTVQTHQQDDKTPRSLLLRWGKSKRRPCSYSVQTHSSRQCDSYIPEMIGCIQHHLIHDVGCYVQRPEYKPQPSMHHNYKSYESKAPQSINLTHKCTEFESMYPCNYLELPSHNNTSTCSTQ